MDAAQRVLQDPEEPLNRLRMDGAVHVDAVAVALQGGRRAEEGRGVTTVMVLGPILREAGQRVKDKSYQRSGVGRDVARFLRALRWTGAADNTLDSYETTLARLAVEHDDYDNGISDFCTPVGTEYLRDFLDRNWQDAAPATRANRLAAIHSLFKWALSEGIIAFDPSAPIKPPRRRQVKERSAYPQDVLHAVVAAQENLRDQCCLQLLGRMGLRKNELRLLKVGDVDLIRNLITVHGKGGVVSVLPLELDSLRRDLYLHIQAEGRGPREYLLYPRSDRERPMDSASVHRWFKRCLENAGLPTTMTLHELRHTALDNLYRETGNIVMAQMLARHTNVSTTQTYLHPTRRDLADALAAIDVKWGSR